MFKPFLSKLIKAINQNLMETLVGYRVTILERCIFFIKKRIVKCSYCYVTIKEKILGNQYPRISSNYPIFGALLSQLKIYVYSMG